MFDLRPVAYVIGLLVMCLGLTMLVPMLVDIVEGRGQWAVFFESAIMTTLAGGLISLASQNAVKDRLSLQQTFLLTTSVWAVLPVFGAIPFVLGATEARFVDAYFEAMSGLTTTGSTVFSGLEELPKGILLWRGLLQWLGGIGIIVVAMVFLPELRVGGMQIFRSEAFDTMGKVLPRAAEIASSISSIYITITLACALAYLACGMDVFDATVHALTTVATGGFANYDSSFAVFTGSAEYVAALFMILAGLPFVRYVQMLNGDSRAIFRDSQVRAFLSIIAIVCLVVAAALLWLFPHAPERAGREALFNIVSIMTGTGYASANYMLWGPFLVALFFFIGLIGGCAGSTACSIKVFRWQLLVVSVRAQLGRIRAPHGIFTPRFEGRPVADDVLSSVMTFFLFFIVTLGLFAVALGMTGLDFITALSGAATALGNIGPGLGPIIGPAGNFAPLNDTAKWLLILAMLMGRLELMAVFVLFTVRFWRA
ncbi:Trk system potassium uptake protein TrkH [Roseivivax sp. THAF40]|uniref:TrkH family potassium uptake protein n=1 Tax=unclassified Roseivivax TaxID=2639302 RepID=UPI001268B24B|nr:MULTISPECIES: TrkH family potassium uptake protein [unclassified Roseivivax]QFS84070.1 Trk system potassium uptake protein TrkH [Roseivivax sp. THAF197b]QFT47897.1 Trk system potassium uptake protein TrkH [Roseivivax sp. THAF40]